MLLELGGLRFLTDPTFDPPGDHAVASRVLVKLAGPALTPGEIGPVDAVLLSHEQHPDNLDTAGRAFLADVPIVLTPPSSAAMIGPPALGLDPWEVASLALPTGGELRVTAVPARHGPAGCEPLTGEVSGFVLTGEALPTVYVSGDNAALEYVSEVSKRTATIDVAIVFAGAAQTALLDRAYLTLTSAMAVEAARILDAAIVVPAHFNGWRHFSEGAEDLRQAFRAAHLAERLVLLEPGEAVSVREAT